jgi:hypothetical protein
MSNKLNARIKNLGNVSIPEPEQGDMKLSVYPFEQDNIQLPKHFREYEDVLEEMLSNVPLVSGHARHFVTIDTKFFTQTECLRREGIHADGNFVVDPNFTGVKGWGGTQPSWCGLTPTKGDIRPGLNGHVDMDWVMPFPVEIPIGDYISDTKGGILCAATEKGCQAWQGEFRGDVGAEGDFSTMESQLTEDKKVVLEADKMYFMTSNTPHETLPIYKGNRRTLIRVTLHEEYPNQLIA